MNDVRGRWSARWVAASTAFALLVALAPFWGSVVIARQAPAAVAQTAPATPQVTLEQQEEFLKKAKVIKTKGAGKGVTGSIQATLSDGTLTHDAHIQTVDQYMAEFRSNKGTEFNFRDTWRYNVAAYRLDRLLDIGMTPPSVQRSHQNKDASFTWWVDDVLMEEGERLKTKTPAPDIKAWNEQMWVVRLFDQLIYNVDRNLGNLVIDKSWRVWMIDHTRAFRLIEKVKSPENTTKCDRQLLERLKTLDEPTLKKVMEDYLTSAEIRGLLARRDQIVTLIEKAGPNALYDRTRLTTQ
jgi:hypothetical protein